MQKTPVTVILPTKNRESLYKAFSSIASQTYNNIQLIIVADGCPNIQEEMQNKVNERALINETRLFKTTMFLKLPKCGNIGLLRNLGLAYANAPYVCFCSDDGYYEPFYIELMVNKLEENNDIVFCPVKNTNLSNETTEWQISELNKYSIADLQHDNGCYIYSGSFMARTSIILNYAWSLNPFEGRLTNRLFSEIFRKPYRIGTISEPVLYNHIETDMTQRETSQDEINNVIANQL